MSEKILGFGEKDVLGYSITVVGTEINNNVVIVKKDKLVPVRLASESVGLKAIRGLCKKQVNKLGLKGKSTAIKEHNKLVTIYVNDLLEWAEKEAKKQAGGKK